jgi:hypothetical protein
MPIIVPPPSVETPAVIRPAGHQPGRAAPQAAVRRPAIAVPAHPTGTGEGPDQVRRPPQSSAAATKPGSARLDAEPRR